MRPGGTNLRNPGDLRCCSQTPYPYDAYHPAGIGRETMKQTSRPGLRLEDRRPGAEGAGGKSGRIERAGRTSRRPACP